MTATTQAPARPAADVRARPTGTIRRVGSAVAMILAPWGFLVTNATYAWAIRDGGGDSTGAEALALAAAYPVLLRVGLVGGMLGCLLLVPAVLGAFRLAPDSRLVLAGGALMVAGYICYFGVLITNFTILAMAGLGGRSADDAAAIDASQADPWATWVFLLFVAGNLVGTAVFAIGLLISRAVPAWAAAGILAWPPLHVLGLVFFGNEVPQVVGAALQAIGFAGCAVALLHSADVAAEPGRRSG